MLNTLAFRSFRSCPLFRLLPSLTRHASPSRPLPCPSFKFTLHFSSLAFLSLAAQSALFPPTYVSSIYRHRGQVTPHLSPRPRPLTTTTTATATTTTTVKQLVAHPLKPCSGCQ
ncbi:hypothetical protein ARMSODRAFT_227443 [Armillaria solidipes]|uniref:Uncharacterized protein n=1 Tax=Armillaria solidipes TaxID=1076256 RepID=A0A2H3CMD9_9AGAR|nr:hypothetical protein ARMSODRAFT_227443 [Armillaria solidipes]